MSFFLFGFISFLVACGLTRLMMGAGITDVPNERSSHDKETPKSGGIAIGAAFLLTLSWVYFGQAAPEIFFSLSTGQFFLFISLTVLIIAAAFIDDVMEVLPFSKLAAQFGAALFFSLFIAHLDQVELPGFGSLDFGVWGHVLTIAWIIFFMNAFNFMDGINGIAGGATIIASLFLFIIAMNEGASFVAMACLVLGAASLGFLFFNFPGGHIFMGDTGSQFIGFVFAALAVFGTSLDQGQVSVYVVPVLFYPFIFDVVVTLGYRALRKQNVLQAHREHLYQIATKLGASHVQVSCVYYGLFVMCGFTALFVQSSGPAGRLMILGGMLVPFAAMAAFIYGKAFDKNVAQPVRSGR